MEENAKKVILKYLEQITGDKKLTRLIVGIVSLIVTYFPIKEMYKTIKLSQIRDYYHLSDEILELDFVDGYKLIFLGLVLTIMFAHARIFFSKEKISRILISMPLIFTGNIIMTYLIIYYLGDRNYFLVELLLKNPKFTIIIIGLILYITFLKEGDLIEIINFIKHPIETIKNGYKNLISISKSSKNIPKLVKFERFIKFLGISYILAIFLFSTMIVLFKNIDEKKVYSYFKEISENIDTEEIEVIIFKLDKKYIIQKGKIEDDNLILYHNCTYQLSEDKLDRIIFNTKIFNNINIEENKKNSLNIAINSKDR
ncbi:Uncharacterised protein [Fusobacterium nucleatum]|uniref:hypothetical protein n=1 Tax=Fusobacterium nucleatum TaxID=851 RepID=UPI00195891A0|nr:hypothetical protein [Fusobacterium nucleatum]VTX49294.1 Uncharacterised protein [Fusobacterium nucleatum]